MSDPLAWFAWIKVSAFIVGMIVGAFAVASPSWVWMKKQVITVAAVWLATLGTGLIGMSIWQSIKIEGAGFSAKLGQIEASLQKTRQHLEKTSQRIAAIGSDVESVKELAEEQRDISVLYSSMIHSSDLDPDKFAAIKDVTSPDFFKEVIVLSKVRGIQHLIEKGYNDEEAKRIVDTLVDPENVANQ